MEAAHVRLPKVPPPTVFASLRGVCWGMIPGGDGLCLGGAASVGD